VQIVVDLDGTICTEEKTYSRSLAKPINKAVESLAKLYEQGHTIIVYSARGWQEYEMTSEWLKNHGIKYHQLVLGKPIGDAWIDDRAIEYDNWDSVIKKLENLNEDR